MINDTPSLTLEHIGYAVVSIGNVLPSFRLLGYEPNGNTCNDVSRKVQLQLLVDQQGNTIELVAPMDTTSPVSNLLHKYGPMPYHLCFALKADEWSVFYEKLKLNGFMLITPPSNAPLLSKDVVFVYSKNLGLVEFVLL